MYDAPFRATIQDYSSCPIDDEHQRQQRMQVKLTGELDPEMFADVDSEVQQDATRCNEGRKDSVSYPMSRSASMAVDLAGEVYTFDAVELSGMSFKRPGKNKDKGSWSLLVALEWDDDDLLFIAHNHREVAKVTLTKLAEAPAAQTTIDDAIGNGGGE